MSNHLNTPFEIVYEEWKELNIFNIKKIYDISTFGNIRNNKLNKILSKSITSSGHETIGLQLNDNSRKTFYVHILVANIFIDNPLNKEIVHHTTLIPSQNYYKFLEFVTKSEHELVHEYLGNNIIITKQKGLWGNGKESYGGNNGMSKWTEDLVHKLCKNVEIGLSYTDALIKEGIDPDENNRSNLSHIIKGHRWKYISNMYNY